MSLFMKQSLMENLQKLYNKCEYQKIVDTLLEIDPEQWGYDLTCIFAHALNELGEYDDALGYLLKVAQQGRKDYMWYVRIGYTYYLQKRYKDASKMFEKALKLQPNNQDVVLFATLAKSAEKKENIHDSINNMIDRLKSMEEEPEKENIKNMIEKLPQEKNILNTHTLLHMLHDDDNNNNNNNITFPIKRNFLKNWWGYRNCFVTNRIMVEGKKIGFMYRDVPKEGKNDSGWRFTAGDESSEYMVDENNFGLYDLNLLCNYDNDIIPFLNSDYGTAYYRDERGIFQRVDPPLFE